jgi:hypothetical protein
MAEAAATQAYRKTLEVHVLDTADEAKKCALARLDNGYNRKQLVAAVERLNSAVNTLVEYHDSEPEQRWPNLPA